MNPLQKLARRLHNEGIELTPRDVAKRLAAIHGPMTYVRLIKRAQEWLRADNAIEVLGEHDGEQNTN